MNDLKSDLDEFEQFWNEIQMDVYEKDKDGVAVKPKRITLEPFNPQTDIKKEYCYHVWQSYDGFTEKYDFCIKCDKKSTDI